MKQVSYVGSDHFWGSKLEFQHFSWGGGGWRGGGGQKNDFFSVMIVDIFGGHTKTRLDKG